MSLTCSCLTCICHWNANSKNTWGLRCRTKIFFLPIRKMKSVRQNMTCSTGCKHIKLTYSCFTGYFPFEIPSDEHHSVSFFGLGMTAFMSGWSQGCSMVYCSCLTHVCVSVFVAKPWSQGANTANTGWASLCWTWSFIRKSWSRHTTTPVHPASVSWTNQPTTNEPLTHEALWILDKKVENVWLSDTFGADDVHFLHHQPHLILSVELLYNDLVCILVYLC